MADVNNEQHKDCSEISVGKIADKEDILLAVVEPYNWEAGTFNQQAFQKKYLKACKQSVARQIYSSPRRLKFFVFDILMGKAGRTEIGVQRFNSRALLDLTSEDGLQQFVIYDAPIVVKNKIDFAHAHIGFSDAVISGGNSAQAAAVLNLRDFLKKNGGPRASKSQFAPVPFLYLRRSEVKLVLHKLCLWRNGEAREFIDAENERQKESTEASGSGTK